MRRIDRRRALVGALDVIMGAGMGLSLGLLLLVLCLLAGWWPQ